MPKMQQHNPMTDMVQYQLDASIQLADAMFSGTEKIDRAMLGATHQTLDRHLRLVKAVTETRDPARLAQIDSAIAARPESVMQCQQEIVNAIAEMQAEFGKSIRNYIERFSHATTEKLSEMSHELGSANRNGDVSNHNPFSSMMSLWNQTIQEAGRLAGQNMMATRSGMERAAHAARDTVVHSAEAGVDTMEHHDEERHTEAHRRHTTKRK